MPIEDGQASAAPDPFEDIAAFMVAENLDGPAPEEDDTAKAGPDEDNPDDGETESDDTATDDDESKVDPSQATQKFKVTVAGDDGTEETLEVDQKELVDGYLRRRDYTVKTQRLAEREHQAVSEAIERVQQGRTHYLQQAQMAHSAVLQLAGLKSPEEMASLAMTDQAAWVQEKQRADAIHGLLGHLQASVQRENAQAQAEADKALEDSYKKSWDTLSKAGFDKTKLTEVYSVVAKKYGFTPQEVSKAIDPRLVLMMRDAAAYQGLKDKKAEVQSKAKAPLPAAKQPVPKNERVHREINKRFQGGRAKLNDLSRYLEANNL